ncbi:MAG: hypothetical protein JWP12_3171 [Bacteroidetes bacterium]|nr:hypothetical protein [Bacteroidota bacterium]
MQKQIIFLTTALLIILFISCSDHPDNTPASGNGNKQISTDSLQKYKTAYNNGIQVFRHQCASCHTPPHQQNDIPGPNVMDELSPDSLQWYLNYVKDSRPFKGRESAKSKKFLKEFPGNYDHVFKDSLSEGQINDLMFFIFVER